MLIWAPDCETAQTIEPSIRVLLTWMLVGESRGRWGGGGVLTLCWYQREFAYFSLKHAFNPISRKIYVKKAVPAFWGCWPGLVVLCTPGPSSVTRCVTFPGWGWRRRYPRGEIPESSRGTVVIHGEGCGFLRSMSGE